MSDQPPNNPWQPADQPPPWGPPPGQPPGGPPGWQPPPGPPYQPHPGYPGYGYPAPQTEGYAIAALVTAVASFVICPLIPAIVALVLANTAMRNIRQSGGMRTGEGLVQAGRVVAWINIGLCALFIVLLIIIAAAGGFEDDGSFESLVSIALG